MFFLIKGCLFVVGSLGIINKYENSSFLVSCGFGLGSSSKRKVAGKGGLKDGSEIQDIG